MGGGYSSNETGRLGEDLIRRLDHPYLSQVISKCLAKQNPSSSEWFTELNSDFVSLSTMLGSRFDSEDLDLASLSPHIFEAGRLLSNVGLNLLEKSKFMTLLSNTNCQSLPPSHQAILDLFLLHNSFLHYSFVQIKNSMTAVKKYPTIYNIITFVLDSVDRILSGSTVTRADKFKYIDGEDLKQILAIAPSFIFQTHLSHLIEHKSKYFRTIGTVTRHLGASYFDLVTRVNKFDDLLKAIPGKELLVQAEYFPYQLM